MINSRPALTFPHKSAAEAALQVLGDLGFTHDWQDCHQVLGRSEMLVFRDEETRDQALETLLTRNIMNGIKSLL